MAAAGRPGAPRLHPVIGLKDLLALVRRRGVEPGELAIVEAKVDGVLVIAYAGRLYDRRGSRPPRYLIDALARSGALGALLELSERYVLMVEVVSAAGPAWLPQARDHDVAAYLVDAYAPRERTRTDLEAAIFRSKALDTFERLELARGCGLELPPFRLARVGSLQHLKALARHEAERAVRRGYEGVVLKLFERYGTRIRVKPFSWMGCVEAKYVPPRPWSSTRARGGTPSI